MISIRLEPQRTLRSVAFGFFACLWLLACSEQPQTTSQKIQELLRTGEFQQANTSIDDAVAKDELSAAEAEAFRKEMERWRSAFQRAELIIVSTLHQLDDRGAYIELRNLHERSTKDRYFRVALFHELGKERFEYWVSEAPKRPRAEFPAPSYPTQPGQIEEGSLEPRVSEGSEEIFGASAYRSLQADVEHHARERNYPEALQMLREQLPLAGSSADRLRELLWEIEDLARADMDRVLEKIERLEGAGQLEAALELAREEMRHFPRSGLLARLTHVADGLSRRIERGKAPPVPEWVVGPKSGGRGETESTSSPSTPEARVAAAIAAGEQRRYSEAAALFEELAIQFEHENPRLHSRYRTEADEARLLGFAKESVARALSEARSAKKLEGMPAGRDRRGKVVEATPEHLNYEIDGEVIEVPWSVLSDQEFAELIAEAVATPLEQLGLAVLYFRLDAREEAEKQLRFALKRDKATKPLLDRILAKARREELREGGYVLDGTDFVSYEAKLRRELERDVGQLVAKAVRQRSDELREKVLAEVLEKGSVARDLAKEDLLARREELITEIQKAPVRGSLQKLLSLRRELDARREHALELIFDAKKYFYPYRPPAVSGPKANEYAEVQAEVDRRVQEVQEIWDGKGISVVVSGALQKKLELLRWMQVELRKLDVDLGDAGDVDQLVASHGVSIQNVALDASDQRYMDYWAEVDAHNEARLEEWIRDKKVTRDQAELLRYTNAYREMMGRHPLRVDLRVMRAAQGHTDEMSTMGYFSHFSPTEGRRTPQERMKLEGYPNPGGENLAINSGPQSAVWAWRHSSGHHRNMLSKGHGDLGTGVSGRYFAQNFGGGNGRWR